MLGAGGLVRVVRKRDVRLRNLVGRASRIVSGKRFGASRAATWFP